MPTKAERKVIKRLRRNYWGNGSKVTKGNLLLLVCPFHGENTASFAVYLKKGEYGCFGCGKNGRLTTLARRYPSLLARIKPGQLRKTLNQTHDHLPFSS